MKEIISSKALQAYGFLLAITHVLTAYFWVDRSANSFVKNGEIGTTLCWPFAPGCEAWRFADSDSAFLFLQAYGIIGVLVAVLFILRKPMLGYFGLVFLLVVKTFATSMSYGLMGNYHYMSFFVQIAYLFIPNKKTLIPFVIGIFYWGAGILKFDPEWLSGVALIVPSFLPGWLQHISLAYVILLECVFVLALYSGKKWLRYAVLFQLVLFHLFSWHIVGYFYPLTMFCLLGLFFLIPAFKEPWQAFLRQDIFLKPAVFIPIAFMLLLQIGPFLVVEDPATSGAPRLVSLNMLDARTDCHALLIRHRSLSSAVYNPFFQPSSIRTQCDPLVYLSQVQEICQADPSENFDFWLQSRRTTGEQFKTRLLIKDVCRKNPATLLWAEIL